MSRDHRLIPGGTLHIFWVRRRAVGKGIDFPDIGIRNGIDFHNLWYKERGINFQDFGMKYRVEYIY